ncbi:hypothetical protein [Micromonospora sp. NPDC005206]|uniref:hypothetical protein n=1 Tax=Micromonospora sp. NPDC005206 TaxID=3157022 RepID=UPI0033AAFC99
MPRAPAPPLAECISCDLDAYRSDGTANRVRFSDPTIDALAERADSLNPEGVPQFLQDYQEA